MIFTDLLNAAQPIRDAAIALVLVSFCLGALAVMAFTWPLLGPKPLMRKPSPKPEEICPGCLLLADHLHVQTGVLSQAWDQIDALISERKDGA